MKRIVPLFTVNIITMIGAVLTTVSAILILTLFFLDLFSFHTGPYAGMMAFLVVPMFFVGGLLLIPVGHWWEHRRERKMLAEGKILEHRLPVIDLNRERTRFVVLAVIAATVLNVAILSAAMYKGMEVMESTTFCGATCHVVMEPEFTTYKRSPHSRVKCVQCHIGEGASWFVKSKLSGSWQLISVAFNLYQKPISTPVHNLRPARETCEQCHWPTKFVGDKLKVIRHFDEDEQNTEKKTVMMIRIGGSQAFGSQGIHWHVDPAHTVRYIADEKRQVIGDVELETADGKKILYKAEGEGAALSSNKDLKWRTMDCVDCHNRPTHIYRSAAEEIDSGLAAGRIDHSLPFIRREGLKALKENYPDTETANIQIHKVLVDFYTQNYPNLTPEQKKAVETAGDELYLSWSSNVFPKMNIKWDTYTPNVGHDRSPGCFRCHDDQHKSSDGKTIPQDCATCHKILAMDEKDPAIMKQLGTPVTPTATGH